VAPATLAAPVPTSTAERQSGEDPFVFWLRPLILAGLAIVLLALTWWDQRPLPGVGTSQAPQEGVPRAAPGVGTVPLPSDSADQRELPVPAGDPGATRTPGPLSTLLDERFTGNQRNWPNNPQSTAWFSEDGYRLLARQPGQFVAIGAPIADPLRDVVVTASFRKVGGPSGGGYGVIVRDQGPGPRDGVNQGGRYYVFEVGDRGELGVWRREQQRWIDLVPWTRSEAVRPGGAANDLTVQAIGEHLTFLVNGVQVVSLVDSAFAGGAVGIFVGGDQNDVLVDRFVIRVPT
jgi:hypothetical protein